jgi:hypothetical protein
MSGVPKLGCVLLLAITCSAQDLQTPKTVRVGVAVMQNLSTRPYPGRAPRDQLVRYLNNAYAASGGRKIQAVTLEATSRAAAEAEAADKDCEYVVFTTLVLLHAVNQPAGQVRVGIDPAPQPPGPPYRGQPVYAASMKFELVRRGEPVVESSVRSAQRIIADDMVVVLMNLVADRVRKQLSH